MSIHLHIRMYIYVQKTVDFFQVHDRADLGDVRALWIAYMALLALGS